jgi:hypothetical protein
MRRSTSPDGHGSGYVLTPDLIQASPTWDQVIQAIREVGFPVVAYLLMVGVVLSSILQAVKFFTNKLDRDRIELLTEIRTMTREFLKGQRELGRAIHDQSTSLSAALIEQSKALTSVSEDVRVLMMFVSRTQQEMNATRTEMQATRKSVEDTVGSREGGGKG